MYRALPPGPHGQNIYAYCHVRTQQVLYSLTPQLQNSALKQLADVGANYNPPRLRKDHWRPFYAVQTDSGWKGLHIFQKLREYRKLHETSWTPPALLARPYNKDEIEKLQKKLDERGGGKMETVFDLIKREKHKMRVRMVMDQKANSVADLAAILDRLEKDVPKRNKRLTIESPQAYEEGRPTLRRVDEAIVLWNDISDKRYARRWPKTAKHRPLGAQRGPATRRPKSGGVEENKESLAKDEAIRAAILGQTKSKLRSLPGLPIGHVRKAIKVAEKWRSIREAEAGSP